MGSTKWKHLERPLPSSGKARPWDGGRGGTCPPQLRFSHLSSPGPLTQPCLDSTLPSPEKLESSCPRGSRQHRDSPATLGSASKLVQGVESGFQREVLVPARGSPGSSAEETGTREGAGAGAGAGCCVLATWRRASSSHGVLCLPSVSPLPSAWREEVLQRQHHGLGVPGQRQVFRGRGCNLREWRLHSWLRSAGADRE